MTWIPRTKFLRPQPDSDLLERAGLLALLREKITSKKLTLISAQAGAGKTTLVARLLAHDPELLSGWITLDEEDNRPETFLALLTEATSNILRGCTHTAAALLAGQPALAAEPQRLVGLLINDILDCDPPPFVLVLDDVHTVDHPDILAALDYLLANLPPMVHLVMTARSDPPLALAKLRARGQLAEIRMAQLRFSAAETAAWLNAELNLALTDAELTLVERYTEGWVTALRLLALSLRERSEGERDRFLQELRGNQQFIFDYLVDEVVRQLPAEKRRFLQETAILSTMTPTLCQTVTGRADAYEQLEALYRQNLFTSRSDRALKDGPAAEPTYRYHTLLRQTLQLELLLKEPQRLAELHRRAAAALGHTLDAVDHYLAAEAWPEAADILAILIRRQVELGTMPAQLVEKVKRLPEAMITNSAWLQAAEGIFFLLRGQIELGRPLLETAARQLAEMGDDLSRAYLLFNLANVSVGGEMAVYLQEIGEIFAVHADAVSPRWQVNYLQAMIWKHIHAHDWPAVEADLESAVSITIRSGEAGAYYTLAANNFTQFFFSPRAAAAILRLKEALSTHFSPEDLLARYGVINISICQHWYRGEVSQAERLALQAQGLSRQYGVATWADVNSLLILLYIQWMRGDYSAFEQGLEALLAHMDEAEAWNAARNDILCWLSLVYWHGGHAAEAQRFLADMEAYTYFERQKINTKITRALLAVADGDIVAADQLLRRAIALEQKVGFTMTVSTQLLLPVLYWQAGERETALRELEIGLAAWARREMPGVVLLTGRPIIPLLEAAVAQDSHQEFASHCLEAFGLAVRPQTRFVPTTGETLTPREAEVLGQIIQGKTNPQIAAELVISETTVKSHVTKILAKLGVSRRTEAAVIARELGLG